MALRCPLTPSGGTAEPSAPDDRAARWRSLSASVSTCGTFGVPLWEHPRRCAQRGTPRAAYSTSTANTCTSLAVPAWPPPPNAWPCTPETVAAPVPAAEPTPSTTRLTSRVRTRHDQKPVLQSTCSGPAAEGPRFTGCSACSSLIPRSRHRACRTPTSRTVRPAWPARGTRCPRGR